MEEMKQIRMKLINTAWVYALLAMAGGVFYREFTKLSGFEGKTTLSVVHTHLFVLGMMFFLIAALFQFQVDVAGQKRFGLFYILYNAGVAVTVIMLICRGIAQVQGEELSRALDASISGIAGLGHICTGIGMLLYFIMLKQAVRSQKE